MLEGLSEDENNLLLALIAFSDSGYASARD